MIKKKSFMQRLRQSVTLAAAYMTQAKTSEEHAKREALYLEVVNSQSEQIVASIKKRIAEEVKQSLCIGDAPRSEVLEGGFIYEYPYETNGTYYHPADTLLRLAQITTNAKTPEEVASAEILKNQLFEREIAIMLEQTYRRHKRIEEEANLQNK